MGFIDHSIQDPLLRVKDAWHKLHDENQYFDVQFHPFIQPTSAKILSKGTATVTYTLEVAQPLCNRANNLHGGAVAAIYDICTSVALVTLSKPGFWEYLGVTRSLNCTYLGPAPSGETFTIECEIVQIGKRMVHVQGRIRGKDGLVKSVCDHMKINSDPPRL